MVKKQLGHPETTDEYITYVYTLALLHSPYAIDILDPLTKGQSLTGSSIIHEMVRVIAIYALGESVDDEDDERDIQRVSFFFLHQYFYAWVTLNYDHMGRQPSETFPVQH